LASHVLTVTDEGQITIPEDLRRELGIEAGDHLHVERDATGIHIETERERAVRIVRETARVFRDYADNRDRPIEEIIAAEKEAFAQAIVDDWIETERRMRPDYVPE